MQDRFRPGLPLLCLSLLLAACGGERGGPPPFDAEYRVAYDRWRESRVDSLTGEDGWLALAGLYWLVEGENRFGSGARNDLVFPDLPALADAPPTLGSFFLDGNEVRVELEPESGVTIDGEWIRTADLRADTAGDPQLLERGSLAFFVIERSGHRGIRLRDGTSAASLRAPQIDTFPLDPGWRIEGRFEPYDPPRRLRLPSVMPWDQDQPSPGALLFELDGREYRLETTGPGGEERLFVVFADRTNDDETYHGGRYLYVDPPEPDGRVVIDFNRAYSPPCLFTPYATCPLPPPQNRLPLRVEAGEKSVRHAEKSPPG